MIALKRLALQNARIFENITIEFSDASYVTGPNGCGKSTLIDAIHAVLENKQSARFIRTGQNKAEIVAVLADGTEARRTITQNGTYPTIRLGDGRMVEKQKETFLKGLASGMDLDPIQFPELSPAEQVEKLLSVMDVRFTRSELAPHLPGAKFTQDEYTLAEVDQFLATLEFDRKELNRDVDRQTKSLQQLTATLEADPDKDWVSYEQELTDKKTSVQTKLQADIAMVELFTQQSIGKAVVDRDNNLAEVKRLYDEAVAKIRADYQVVADAARKELGESKDAFEREAYPVLEDLRVNIAIAKERAIQQHKQAGTKETIEELRRTLKADTIRQNAVQERVEALRKLRKSRLDAISIEGVTITENNEIFVDGLAFNDQLNTAAKQMLSFKLFAKFRDPKKLPLFICDGSGIDRANIDALAAACREIGFQLIIAKEDSSLRELTVIHL